jgi:hypothetical protein
MRMPSKLSLPAEELAGAVMQSHPQFVKRIIGPHFPSAEELVASAMQSQPQSMMSDKLDDDNDILICHPPPTMVAEAKLALASDLVKERHLDLHCEVNKCFFFCQRQRTIVFLPGISLPLISNVLFYFTLMSANI